MGIDLSEKESKKITGCALVLILLISCIPLYSRFLVISSNYHDLVFHLSRLEGLAQALKTGQFPVRMQTYQLNGYGYPVSIMYGDLFLYPFAVLSALGVPTTFSYKLLVVSVNALTVFSTYWIARRILSSRTIAIVAALVWTLAPYRLEDVYMRGAVGEYIALTFLPVILFGLYSLFYPAKRGAARHPWIVLSFGVSAVILSHLLSIILFIVPLAIVYIVGFVKNRRSWASILKQTGLAVISAVGLCCWFVWPLLQTYAMVPLNVRTQGTVTYPDAPQVFQLLELFAPMTGGTVHDPGQFAQFMPTAIGWGVLLLSAVFLFMLFLDHREADDHQEADLRFVRGLGITLDIVALCVIVLSSNIFPWGGTPFPLFQKVIARLRVIQFSWRFVGIATVLLIAVGCCGLFLLVRTPRVNRLAVACVAVIASISLLEGCFAMSSLLRHSMTAETPFAQHYSEIGSGEYLIADTKTKNLSSTRPRAHGAVISHYSKNGTTMAFHSNARKNAWIDLPAFDYPNYHVKSSVGGAGIRLEDGPNHVIRLRFAQSFNGEVTVFYREPISWRIGELISVGTVIGMLVCLRSRKHLSHNRVVTSSKTKE